MNAAFPDQDLRLRALDPSQSFLVQAPAGAGKTELLIRRYLRLLAGVDQPEEILAVTFTRKAAAEIRRRVCDALGGAAGAAPAGSPASRETAELARAALARDADRGWSLTRHPARLRIGTIDSLNGWIARTAPVSSGANVLRRVSDRPTELYAEAARQVVLQIAEDGGHGPAVTDLLAHLDNRVERLQDLLAAMLAQRDQWLPVIGPGTRPAGDLRARLEAVLRQVVAHRLGLLPAAVPAELADDLHAVIESAAAARGVAFPPAAVDQADAAGLSSSLAWWRFAADTLLTREGTWRNRLTRAEGFPTDEPDSKRRALELLAALRGTPTLDRRLHEVRELPDPAYSATQWRALEALLAVLPLAAAELKIAFAARGETDFIEIAADAVGALGSEDEPGEPGLRLDARVRHIMLDEFQDTSQSQLALLNALTRGWSPGDGRTVFLVGDPMQSIYRFRQAEVRLFLDARDAGLPGVELEFIRLSTNFRSVPAIVDWVNDTFARVFPLLDDPLTSAVAFAPSAAAKPPAPETGVVLHDMSPFTRKIEGERVAALVAACLRDSPDDTIGILVRTRAQAAETLAALHVLDVPYGAVDLLHLGETSLANDLLALTRALTHRGDRLAWFAVLRAPWCGLSLADLAALGEGDSRRSVFDLITSPGRLAAVSADGRARLQRFRTAWERADGRLGKLPLRDVIEGLWLELGGPACAGADLAYADVLLDYIGRHDRGGDCPDALALGVEMSAQAASFGTAAGRVQVLTIHKAKGLQFDTVIVPELGARTRRDDRPALLWQEIPLAGGRPELFLAPINAAGTDGDPLYELLWRLQVEQSLAESDRLLYVAATRAVKRLHLFGRLAQGTAPGNARPARGSLLDRLWPAVGREWPADGTWADPPMGESEDDPTAGWRQPALRRLHAEWQLPGPPAALGLRGPDPAPGPGPVLFDWASFWAMHAGSVVHRWLLHLATAEGGDLAPAGIRALRPRFRQQLVQAGVDAASLDRATDRVCAALEKTVADERGRWILARHRDAVSEYALTMVENGGFRHLVVDRSFVSEDGDRWVIDYKTSSHEGGDVDAFLAAEAERYREQLARYRDAFARLESRRVRTALYFPLLGRLHEVGWPENER